MSMCPFCMVRLQNKYGRFCWHNACAFMTIHCWKICKIPIPEAQESENSDTTYLGEFLSWLRLTTSEERCPKQALACFTQEFLPEGSAPVANATQDAIMFFQALNGELKDDPNAALQEFNWMQPMSQQTTWTNREVVT